MLVITLDSCERQGIVRPCKSRSLLKIGIGLKAVGDDDDFSDDGNDDDGNDDDGDDDDGDYGVGDDGDVACLW